MKIGIGLTLLVMVGTVEAQGYVLPPPPRLTVPQGAPPPVQQQPIYGNPGQQAGTTPMPTPQPRPGYVQQDCKVTPMGTLICRTR